MSETEEDLRTTSDAVLKDAQHIEDLEIRKRQLDPDDPQRVDLAEEIDHTGQRLARSATAERHLAIDAKKEAEATTDAEERTIEGTQPG